MKPPNLTSFILFVLYSLSWGIAAALWFGILARQASPIPVYVANIVMAVGGILWTALLNTELPGQIHIKLIGAFFVVMGVFLSGRANG